MAARNKGHDRAGASTSARTRDDNEAAKRQETDELTLENTRPFSLKEYELFAKVLRIVDGDTIVLGFKLWNNRWNARCRCAGFNCAEMRASSQNEREAAQRARNHIAQILQDKIVKVRFESDDKYGRPIVNITLPDGRNLCQVMISGGYAAAYNGRGEKKY